MIWLVSILTYALFGIVFAAWIVGKEKEPEEFSDDPYLWLFINVPFWPFIGLGYLIKELFVRLVDGFRRTGDIALSTQPDWTPSNKRLPEERDWYLGIFKEPDTGWINPVPFVCDYLLGKKTKATTKEGWILKGFTDREKHIDYYFNLECVAWMPLPESYTERE